MDLIGWDPLPGLWEASLGADAPGQGGYPPKAARVDEGGPSDSQDGRSAGPIPSGQSRHPSSPQLRGVMVGSSTGQLAATDVAMDDMQCMEVGDDDAANHEEVEEDDPWFAGMGVDDSGE